MNAFFKKKVLITGGLGFIGSNLAFRLVTMGARVTLVDSMIPQYGGCFRNIAGIEDRVVVNISDVRDEFGMNYLVKEQDFLFNLAGQTSHLDSMENPYPDLEINCRSQLSILEACRLHNPGIRIVFASTRQIYGRPQYLPVNEDHPLVPVDVNGINKIAGEMYHLLYSQVYGVSTTSLRLTNTYGPRMRVKDARQTFLGIWIHRIIEKQPIAVFGDGLQVRDFHYVDDVVRALLLAGESKLSEGEVFNLGGESLHLKDLVRLIIKIAQKGNFELIPFPDERKKIEIGSFVANYEKIKNTLGWEPKIGLKEGIRKTVGFYEKHRKEYW